jgi:hypothetical protein
MKSMSKTKTMGKTELDFVVEELPLPWVGGGAGVVFTGGEGVGFAWHLLSIHVK